MSFVYDTRLLRELLKIGQQGQQGQPPVDDDAKRRAANRVQMLVDDLQKQMTPPQTPEEQSTAVSFQQDPANPNATAPKLFSTNMETLGALVAWCAQNKITVGGQRIAYNLGEQPPGDDWVLYKLEPNSGLLEVESRETVKRGFYINNALLVTFIQSRLAALQKKPNKVEEVMLGMRIDEANKLLGTNINKQYSEPVNEEDAVDNLPPVLDVKNWGQTGSIPLKLKDVKAIPALKQFLSRAQIVLRDRKGHDFRSDDMQNFNICSILTVLALRAANMAQGETSGKQKTYVERVAQLQQQANCASQQGQGDQGGGGVGGNPQLLQQLTTLRPFNAQYVSFPEIRKWLETYASYANDPDVTDTGENIKGYMDSFKEKSNSAADTIQLNNLDTNRFKSMLKNPADAVNMGNYLYDIVSQAGSLYQRMVTQLQNLANDQRFSQAYRAMQQQITAGGPQQTNLSDLDDLRQNLARAWQQHK
jgi:hypothetical protein